MPDLPEVLPELDNDRQLFEWLRDEGKLVMVFLPGQHESIMGRIEAVGSNPYQLQLVNEELEVAEELLELEYDKTHLVVTGTHLFIADV